MKPTLLGLDSGQAARRPLAVQLAYYYPPTASVATLRNGELTRALVEAGYRVAVVTSQHTPPLAAEAEHVAVHRVRVLDYRSRPGGRADFAPPATLKRGLAYRLFAKATNGFPSNLALGEGGPLYLAGAYLAARALIRAEGRPALVYSSFRPWADVQVAYLLRRRFGRFVRWWCDWRDTPFELRHRNYYALGFQRRVVGRLLAEAHRVTAVSAGVADDLSACGADAELLRNGCVVPEGMAPRIHDVAAANEPTLFYAGSLYGEFRDARPLFEALTRPRLRRWRAAYAGKDGAQWARWASERGLSPKRVPDFGILPRAEVLARMRTASANVLLTWANPGQTGGLTMKLYEYLYVARPILRVHVGPDDPELDAVLAEAAAPTYTHVVGAPLDGLTAWLETLTHSAEVPPPQSRWLLSSGLAAAVAELPAALGLNIQAS